MADDCHFCTSIQKENSEILPVDSPLFVGMWDGYPATPGHALVIPKRHVQYSHELNGDELATIMGVVVAVKQSIKHTDLQRLYQTMLDGGVDNASKTFITQAQGLLAELGNRPPDAFNDGLNDGPVAGQTIPHFHWHIMPRWSGDSDQPRGGIRHMFDVMGNYEQGNEK